MEKEGRTTMLQRRHGCRGGVGRLGSTILVSALVWFAMIQYFSFASRHIISCLPTNTNCLDGLSSRGAEELKSIGEVHPLVLSPPSDTVLPAKRRNYKSNGYLVVSCNGGLNQMRAGIADMVTVARCLNLTFVIPELDKKSFWDDASDFVDIFDVDHFINSLRGAVKVVKDLPPKLKKRLLDIPSLSVAPISWSNVTYYKETILPTVRKKKVIHFLKTDSRLANNGIPIELQNLRCYVNYEALRFTPLIESLGEKLISNLHRNGFFVGLHLRYEMDMLAFSGCSHGCSDTETDELTRMRYLISWWKEKEINSEQKRMEGLCPLTPDETALVLKALGFEKDTTLYIAAGQNYGGERRLAGLRAAFPQTVRKEKILSADEMAPLMNHSSQMAALDYKVSLASDVFIPTYDGNMARVVEGHRRYSGFRKSITLDRRELVELIDLYQKEKLSWDQFCHAVQGVHKNRVGQPTVRKVVPGMPKLEDNFYANPQECLVDPPRDRNSKAKLYDI